MLNRQAMIDEIIKGMGFHVTDRFTTVHNYIDTDEMILRKGAVSAKSGERLLIPINMRDGSLICRGREIPTGTVQLLTVRDVLCHAQRPR